MKDCSICIILQEDKDHLSDYFIENNTDKTLIVRQKGTEREEIVSSHSTLPYIFADLTLDKKVTLTLEDSMLLNDMDFDEVKQEEVVMDKVPYILEVRVEHFIRVLSINEKKNIKAPPPNSIAELRTVQDVALMVPSVSISLIDNRPGRRPQEMMLVYIDRVDMTYKLAQSSDFLELKVAWMQIDNDLFGTPYPVILASDRLPKAPLVHLAFSRSLKYKGVQYFNFFGFRLQEIDVSVDEIFLRRMLDFVKIGMDFYSRLGVQQKREEEFIVKSNNQLVAHVDADESAMLYFEVFFISPIRVNVSFLTVPGTDIGGFAKEKGNMDFISDKLSNPLVEFALDRLELFANVERAPIRLHGLAMTDPFLSQNDLLSRISQHYTYQALTEIYKVVGSADFLGNPVGLFSNIGTGVYDFFHEPAEGLTSSPFDFGAGIMKGTSSLVKRSIFGLFNTGEKLTGTVTNIAAMGSLDDEWRRKRVLRAKPKNVLEGVAQGAKFLGESVMSGFADVVEQPQKGYHEKGGLGLFAGVGKGLASAIVKPLVGTGDLVARTFEGIKNSAMSEHLHSRVRPPRFFTSDGVLKPYNEEPALGQETLYTLEDKKFKNHFYVAHFKINKSDWVLLSDHSIFGLTGDKLPKVKIDWQMTFYELQKFHYDPKAGIVLEGIGSTHKIKADDDSTTLKVYTYLDLALRSRSKSEKQS
eukprot:TRINITY_DN1760_c0_g2_i1.p1 TRINITY_DN1760_c0_g2~~TRINITY_DN1760_c0_g2_i1.p1  ORF type:complete len:697 (-),score=241.36 TRINITY_DN1760_c0_g2_i1:117-2207(-)